jgi:hypothetical protein
MAGIDQVHVQAGASSENGFIGQSVVPTCVTGEQLARSGCAAG